MCQQSPTECHGDVKDALFYGIDNMVRLCLDRKISKVGERMRRRRPRTLEEPVHPFGAHALGCGR